MKLHKYVMNKLGIVWYSLFVGEKLFNKKIVERNNPLCLHFIHYNFSYIYNRSNFLVQSILQDGNKNKTCVSFTNVLKPVSMKLACSVGFQTYQISLYQGKPPCLIEFSTSPVASFFPSIVCRLETISYLKTISTAFQNVFFWRI